MPPRRFFLVLLALLWPAIAAGQPCLTCRTERCPQKTTLKEWCGEGQDPLRRAERPRRKKDVPASAAKTTPAPALEQASPPEEKVPAPPPPPDQAVPPPILSSPVLAPPASPSPVRPSRRGALWVPGWVLLSVGVVSVVSGGALLGVDGTPTCDREPTKIHCPEVLDTWAGGTTLVVAGGATLIGASIMIDLSAHPRERGRNALALSFRP